MTLTSPAVPLVAFTTLAGEVLLTSGMRITVVVTVTLPCTDQKTVHRL